MKIYFKFKRDEGFNILDHKADRIKFERSEETEYQDVQKTINSFFKELLKEAKNRDQSLERFLEISLANDGFPTRDLSFVFLSNLAGWMKPTTVYCNLLKSLYFVFELSALEVCLLKRTCNLLDIFTNIDFGKFPFDGVSEFLNYTDRKHIEIKKLMNVMHKNEVLRKRIKDAVTFKEEGEKSITEKINLDELDTEECILRLLSSYIVFFQLDYDELDIHFSVSTLDNTDNLVIKSSCGKISFEIKPREIRYCKTIAVDIEELKKEIEEFLLKGDNDE